MNCQNRFCVYWKENACVLEEVSLDAMGVCQQCILVNVPDSCIEAQRAIALELLEETAN